ncbi:hypothetical protein VTL71DRAFT_15603 [Oculimacula yallundae]|uniref:RING-type domain-containing protein n=1 Tax=Oculimacula yallundae TaxID=86028 RepID=A0ABR4CHS5_9HELO
MCQKVQVHHASCNTSGEFVIRPCRTPTTCGEPVTVRLSFRLRPYPDFCPDCFLQGGLFISNVNQGFRAAILSSPLYRNHTSDKSLNIAESLWRRAENGSFRDDDLECYSSQLHQDGTSDMTKKMIDSVMELLLASFWHQVMERMTSPPKSRRVTILRILNFMIRNFHKNSQPPHALQQLARPRRPEYLRAELSYPDITSLTAVDLECNICLDNIRVVNSHGLTESLVQTSCNHLFGDQCLRHWIVDNENCPICRGSLLTFTEGQALFEQELTAARQRTIPPPWVMTIFGIPLDSPADDLEICQYWGAEALLKLKE